MFSASTIRKKNTHGREKGEKLKLPALLSPRDNHSSNGCNWTVLFFNPFYCKIKHRYIKLYTTGTWFNKINYMVNTIQSGN